MKYELPSFAWLRCLVQGIFFLSGLIIIEIASTQTLTAASVSLAWSPSLDPTVAGYKIYYGGASGVYTNLVNVGGTTSVTIAGLVPGTTYYFAATTYGGSAGESPFSNEVTYAVPYGTPTLDPLGNPIVNVNTGPQTMALTGISSGTPNDHQTLTVGATTSNRSLTSTPIISYSSPGATGTLTFRPGSLPGVATITVTVGDNQPQNNVFSRTFTVTMLPQGVSPKLPAITSPPADRVAAVGQTVTFSVAAVAADALTYQWQFNSANLPAATNAVLTLSNVTANAAGRYAVTVSDLAGPTNSNPASLTVYATASPTLGPAVAAGGQYAFKVSGVPGYNYMVQASTNLVNWVSVQTNVAPFTFVEVNLNQFSRRFYRAAYLP